MSPLIFIWAGSVLAAAAGLFLFKGPRSTAQPRWISMVGAELQFLCAAIFGPDSQIFAIILPLALILTAAGGLLFSKQEDPIPDSTQVYAAVLTAIAGMSLCGWAVVAAN